MNSFLSFSQVKIWFQNRRMKWRNSKERELLANGGSREQTLPNKNNPNPDLSDVKESFVSRTVGRAADREDLEDLGEDEVTGVVYSGADLDGFHDKSDVDNSNATQEPLESLIAASQLSLTHAGAARVVDSTTHRLSNNGISTSSESPKLLIKDLATLGAASTNEGYSSTANGLSFGRYADEGGSAHEQDFSDEDINVTDDMTPSNNEESDVD